MQGRCKRNARDHATHVSAKRFRLLKIHFLPWLRNSFPNMIVRNSVIFSVLKISCRNGVHSNVPRREAPLHHITQSHSGAAFLHFFVTASFVSQQNGHSQFPINRDKWRESSSVMSRPRGKCGRFAFPGEKSRNLGQFSESHSVCPLPNYSPSSPR